jgi:hypothetical protein
MQASRAASISLSVRTTLERTRERIALFRIGRREREPTANRVRRPRFVLFRRNRGRSGDARDEREAGERGV